MRLRALLDRAPKILWDPFGSDVSTPRPFIHLMRLFVLILGGWDAWTSRHAFNPDGVSYLDLGDAMARGDFEMALNAYWSPLYPIILLVVRAFTGFSPALELPAVHLANFLIYAGVILAFEYLVRGLLRGESSDRPSSGVLILAGYGFFGWLMVAEGGLHHITPDLCVAISVYLAAGMVVRMRDGWRGARPGVLLGVVLALGYLAKTPMLLLGAGYLGVAWLAAGGPLRGWRTALPAAGSFALISGAFVLALSLNAGRFTYGDSGKLNYAWFINGVQAFVQARPNQGEFGTLRNAPAQLTGRPRVYEFAEPIRATYPLWFAPAYFYEGVEPQPNLDRQLGRLGGSWNSWMNFFDREHLYLKLAFICLLMALLCAPTPRWRAVLGLVSRYELWLLAMAALLMFSMIKPNLRYCATFLVLLFVALAAGVRVTGERWGKLVAPAMAIAVVIAFSAARDLSGDQRRARPDDLQWRVAQALHEEGLRPGDRIGHVGKSTWAFWARLGRFRIIAEVPHRDRRSFWQGPEQGRQRALDAFRSASVKAVIATTPRRQPPAPWRRLGDTDFYVLHMNRREE